MVMVTNLITFMVSETNFHGKDLISVLVMVVVLSWVFSLEVYIQVPRLSFAKLAKIPDEADNSLVQPTVIMYD